MKPYFDDGNGRVIYHGECREVMELWTPNRTGAATFDLLLTDPPYGIGEGGGKHVSRNTRGIAGPDYGVADWDDAPAHDGVVMARSLAKHQIIFGGNYYHLPPSSCWLVWDKDNTGDFADCELAWTNLKKAVRRLVYRWNGMLQQPGRAKELRQHPTQKPEPVMVWALTQAPESVRTVLDPFMGSGTTLVAAKRLGRKAIGIEREEKYCEVAARRLSQEALPLEVA
jgi:DNA modification methylase